MGKGGGSDVPLLGVALDMLGGRDGLSRVLDGFEGAGLGAAARSWIGEGANAPIGGDDVKSALGADAVRRAAEGAGVTEDEAADGLAGLLPGIIDRVTPDGRIPRPERLADLPGGVLRR